MVVPDTPAPVSTVLPASSSITDVKPPKFEPLMLSVTGFEFVPETGVVLVITGPAATVYFVELVALAPPEVVTRTL